MFFSKKSSHYNLTSSTKNKIAADVSGRYPAPTSCAQAIELNNIAYADRAAMLAKERGEVESEYITQFGRVISVYTKYLETCKEQIAAASSTGNPVENVTPTTSTTLPAPAPTPVSAAAKKINWLLIGGIGVGMIVAGVIVYKIIKKKGKS